MFAILKKMRKFKWIFFQIKKKQTCFKPITRKQKCNQKAKFLILQGHDFRNDFCFHHICILENCSVFDTLLSAFWNPKIGPSGSLTQIHLVLRIEYRSSRCQGVVRDVALMNRLNKTGSAIFILYFSCSRGIDF